VEVPLQADTPKVQPKRPPDKTLVYKKTPQRELRLSAYLPSDWKKTDQRPAIVFFFGGGWFKGTPEQFYSKSEYLAARGLVAFCAEYRLTGVDGVTVDKCVEDARSAMRYVRGHAAELGVDANKLVSAGGSAGAHLAACVAPGTPGFAVDDPNDDLSISCVPQAMVLFNPVLDTDDLRRTWKTPDYVLGLVSGNSEQEKRQALLALSPLHHVAPGLPPAILFYGTNDAFLAHGRAWRDKGRAVGNRVELWTAEGLPHGFFNAAPWHQATLIAVDRFLCSLGFVKGPATIAPASDRAVLREDAAPAPSLK
jgi:acetyl esterase/lipase